MLIRIVVEHKSEHAPGLWLQFFRTIGSTWESQGYAPVIPVVLHTGPEAFRFETPQSRLRFLPAVLHGSLPVLTVYPIDLATCSEERLWNSPHLDHVSKVALSILKLAQQQDLDIGRIRALLRREWPGISEKRRRRYILAAINYLHYKSDADSDTLQLLSSNMALVHSVNPKSAFAKELREEHAKGLQEGVERGLALDKIDVVAGMLANGLDWDLIQKIAHLDQAGYEALSAKYKE